MSDDEDLKKQAQGVLDGLTPREREVLKRRFGIDIAPNTPFEEVATRLDITREKIHEVERRALERLRSKGNPDEPA